MKLRQIIRDYFSFDSGERTGLIVLIFIICFLMLLNRFIFYFEEPTLADEQAFEAMLAKFEEMEKLENVESLELFPFDPNTVDSIAFMRLNLPRYVKRNVLSYRWHGGKFGKPSDLRKIYGMNDSIFDRIESFIRIANKPFVKAKKDPNVNSGMEQRHDVSPVQVVAKTELPEIKAKIDLNKATAEEFEKLRGIGPVLSMRIVKYRNLLGGYAFLDQLSEVYGIKPEVVQENRNKLELDTVDVKKIDLNFASIEELAAHPYLNYKDAGRIVDFRSKNGYISDKNILFKDSIIGIDKFRKLVFYLK